MMSTVGEILPGDIHYFFGNSPSLYEKKEKFHLCVAPGWFFVFNTRRNFPFSLEVTRQDCRFLIHDSYICCRNVIPYDLDRPVPKTSSRGTLPKALFVRLIAYIPQVETLTESEQKKILDALTTRLRGMP